MLNVPWIAGSRPAMSTRGLSDGGEPLQGSSIAFYLIGRAALNAASIRFRLPFPIAQNQWDFRMTFGKRFSQHNDRVPTIIQETCVRCCGTGRIRERGDRIICKACTGAGRVAVKAERRA